MTTAAPRPITLALADDHALFREGVRALIEDPALIVVVGEASNGQELLELLDSGVRPDVVLLDMQMPVLDGLQTTRLLRQQYPEVRVIILSMHDDTALVRLVLAEGATAFLSKMAPLSEVRQAVLTAAGRTSGLAE